MPKASTPPEIQAEVQKLIEEFNQEHFNVKDFKEDGLLGYSARFKGKYLYLDRDDFGVPSPICLLSWNGGMDNWGFAIYKYSLNHYDPDEWFFPGNNHVDGTVTGALKASLEAYQI